MTSLAISPYAPAPGGEQVASVPRAWRGKRLFDLAVCMVLLVLSVPVFVVVAAVIALTSPGPIFFRQRRVGFAGTEFEILKLRTMHVGAEDVLAEDPDLLRHYLDGDHKVPRRLDPRVTRVGRFLRLSSLDELPQFWNVLKGDMSLVGPRPELPWLVERYKPEEFRRLLVPPGLTGWWQVNARAERPMHMSISDDLYYVDNYSLWLDLWILLKTPSALWRARGAF